MSAPVAIQLPLSGSSDGLLTTWSLVSPRAVLLGAQSGGFLQVDKGTVWLTLDGPHQGPANDWGDRVLACGTRIHVTAGQHIVLERLVPAANEAVCFSWEPDAAAASASAPGLRLRAGLRSGWSALRALAAAVGQWLAPAPTWPRDSTLGYAQAKEQAWNSLYHLRSNQP